MQFVFLGLLAVCFLIHLFFTYKRNAKGRACTKWTLMLLVLGWYCARAEVICIFAVLAMLFSWAGDVCLIPKSRTWFNAGVLAFMISHVFYCITYYPGITFSSVSPMVVAAVSIVYLLLIVFEISRIISGRGLKKCARTILYLVINGTMNIFALMLMLSNMSCMTILVFAGAALFFISDVILIDKNMCKKSIFQTSFMVMITYLIGQFLIATGLSLM